MNSMRSEVPCQVLRNRHHKAEVARLAEREQRLYDALKRITAYMPPETLAKHALKKYGLEAEEAIEMAYDNVLAEAAAAIKGMRRPMAPTQPGSKEPHATQAESRPDGQDKYLPSSQASSQTLDEEQPK